MVAPLLMPPAGADVVETCGGRLWLAGGIVHEAIDVQTIELEHVRGLVDGVRSLVGWNKPSLLLTDLTKVRATSSEARVYSSSDEMRDVVAAQAILVGSPVTRVIAGFFVRVFQPPFPVRLFTASTHASDWLRGLRRAATA